MPQTPRPPTHQRAHRWDIWYCGHCPNAHLLFYNSDDVLFCEATFSAQQCDRVAASIRARDPNFKTPTGGEPDR